MQAALRQAEVERLSLTSALSAGVWLAHPLAPHALCANTLRSLSLFLDLQHKLHFLLILVWWCLLSLCTAMTYRCRISTRTRKAV